MTPRVVIYPRSQGRHAGRAKKPDPNLDHDPAFWFVTASLMPFIVAIEIVYRLSVFRDRCRRHR